MQNLDQSMLKDVFLENLKTALASLVCLWRLGAPLDEHTFFPIDHQTNVQQTRLITVKNEVGDTGN